MSHANAKMNRKNPLTPELPFAGQEGWERWTTGLLAVLLFAAAGLSVTAPKSVDLAKLGLTKEAGAIVPALLAGLALLLLIVKLHLASQRKLLREISAALAAAGARADRLEQFSFLDAETQLFNRNYLDRLFSQASKWLNRSGTPVTILLFELHLKEEEPEAEHIVAEAALILRANFRGSDYILRFADNQFLVLLPETSDGQAHYALTRLNNKIDHWNLENEKLLISLRHQAITCEPGTSLWASLEELEQKLRQMPASGEAIPESAAAAQAGQESF